MNPRQEGVLARRERRRHFKPEKPEPLHDRLLILAEVADTLRCSVRTVGRLLEEGKLRGVKVASRVRIRESSLVAYMVSHRTKRL